MKLKETSDIPKNIMSKVTEEDLSNFRDLEEYKKNRLLFQQLDNEFYNDFMDQTTDVDCILQYCER